MTNVLVFCQLDKRHGHLLGGNLNGENAFCQTGLLASLRGASLIND